MATSGSQVYYPRLVDGLIAQRLASAGAVVLEGAKGLGKTTTAQQFTNSALHFGADTQAAQLFNLDPAAVLAGERPRLLSEWQVVPASWNQVRHAVDDADNPGQFMLTSSAQPPTDPTRHPGTGRFSRLPMGPLTLLESGMAQAAVSLAGLSAGEQARAAALECTVTDVIQRMVHGGFPNTHGQNLAAATRFNRGYLDQMARFDVPGSCLPNYDPTRISALIRALAQRVATAGNVAALAQATHTGGAKLARSTVTAYLHALKHIFFLNQQPAWAPALRSRARLRKSPKLHLVDVALAIAALRTNVQGLLTDLNTLGLLFESFVFQHLLVYSAPIGGTVYHYCDSNDLEADAIIELRDGSWMAFEVKLGAGHIDQAAHSLLRLAAEVKKEPPAALVVLIPTGYAYTRNDGVQVVPLTLLGP